MAVVSVFIAAALLSGVGSTASNNSPSSACEGYLVVGAGSSSVDGCYTDHGVYENRPLFILDNSNNQLYAFQGTWKLGVSGHNVSYHAVFMSDYPPESLGGCGTWSPTLGEGPCPAVHRVGLPPGPPLPPPPPPPPLAPSPPPPPMHLTFQDDFNGDSVNTSKWVVHDKVLDHGGMWMKDNVVVANGTLVLRAVAHNYTAIVDGVNTSFYVSGAGVSTQRLFEQHTGRWEASVKMPRPNEAPSYTLHSSVWLNSGDAVNSTTKSGCGQEIDIIEQYAGPQPPNPISFGTGSLHAKRGHCTSSGTSNNGCTHITPIHTGSASARDRGDEIWTGLGDYTSGWTLFTLDWTHDWITIRVNNTLVASYTENTTITRSFTDAQPLIFTSTIMERAETLPQDKFPQEFLVDWVRVYAWDD